MFYQDEQARTQRINACSKIRKEFKRLGDLGIVDAVYRTASRQDAVGFSDLPYEAPICTYLLNQKDVAAFLEKQTGSILIQYQKHKIYFMSYQIHIGKTELDVKVIGGQDKFRTGSTTKYEMDGRKIESTFQYPSSGKHQIVIHL